MGLEVSHEPEWEPAARARLEAIASFARGMVVKAVEAYAHSIGRFLVSVEMMAEVRQEWGARFRPRE